MSLERDWVASLVELVATADIDCDVSALDDCEAKAKRLADSLTDRELAYTARHLGRFCAFKRDAIIFRKEGLNIHAFELDRRAEAIYTTLPKSLRW